VLCSRDNSIYSVSRSLRLLGPANLCKFYRSRSRTKRSIGMNDIRKCQQFSRKQREEFFSEINDDVTRTCRTSLGVLSIVRARFHERTPSTRAMRPSTDIDVLECFLLRSINPRTGGASGMMGIRTSRFGRDRPLLDWTESDTKIAQSSFHRSTSSVPLGPRRERPRNYSGDTPGHPDQPIANAAPAPKSRPGALCYNNTFSLSFDEQSWRAADLPQRPLARWICIRPSLARAAPSPLRPPPFVPSFALSSR